MIRPSLKHEATRLLSKTREDIIAQLDAPSLTRRPDYIDLLDTLHHTEKIGCCRRAIIAALNERRLT